MDAYTIETKFERMFVAMPREWLLEAEVIERYNARLKNYENVPMTTGAFDSTTDDNSYVHDVDKLHLRRTKFN